VVGSVFVAGNFVEARTTHPGIGHPTGGHHHAGALHAPHHASFHPSAAHAGEFARVHHELWQAGLGSKSKTPMHGTAATPAASSTNSSSSSSISPGNRDLRHDRHDL